MARSKRNRPSRCICCGRPLSDEASVARSVGPDCLADERCLRTRAAAAAPKRYVLRWLERTRYAVVDTATGAEVERGMEPYARQRAAELNADAYLGGMSPMELNAFKSAD